MFSIQTYLLACAYQDKLENIQHITNYFLQICQLTITTIEYVQSEIFILLITLDFNEN